MTFSADGLHFAIQSSFEQGGLHKFERYCLNTTTKRRWVIAADFNIGSPNSSHDVYAFSAYPVGNEGYVGLSDRLNATFPADFKNSRIIQKSQKHFFKTNEDCFLFVILAPVAKMAFCDHGDHYKNLEDARRLCDDLCRRPVEGSEAVAYKISLKKFQHECKKGNLSLLLLDRMLNLTIFTSWISKTICLCANAEHIAWFPDRDNMTTYCNSVWSDIAMLNFYSMLNLHQIEKKPTIGVLNHRVRMDPFYDPLIRIPDYIAAAFSRWDLDARRIVPPAGTKRSGAARYKSIVRNWAADNDKLWLSRVFRDDDRHYRCASISATKHKKR